METITNVQIQNTEDKLRKEDLFFNLRKCSNIISKYYNKRLKSVGITINQFYTLLLIKNEFLNIRELSSVTGCDRTTTNRCISNIKKLELIVKSEKNVRDRRPRHYDLTQKGKECVDKSITLLSSAKKDIINTLTKDVDNEAIFILNKICDNLSGFS